MVCRRPLRPRWSPNLIQHPGSRARPTIEQFRCLSTRTTTAVYNSTFGSRSSCIPPLSSCQQFSSIFHVHALSSVSRTPVKQNSLLPASEAYWHRKHTPKFPITLFSLGLFRSEVRSWQRRSCRKGEDSQDFVVGSLYKYAAALYLYNMAGVR